MWKRFWIWYERHYEANLGMATGLFALQAAHLVWLGVEVIATRLTGAPLLDFNPVFRGILIIFDYTEIPSLIGVTLVYLHSLRSKFELRSVLYIVLLNLQWLHLFWLTDEFVLGTFSLSETSLLPVWAAWIAILIDYLEIPVMIDTARKFLRVYRSPRGLPRE